MLVCLDSFGNALYFPPPSSFRQQLAKKMIIGGKKLRQSQAFSLYNNGGRPLYMVVEEGPANDQAR